MSVIIVNPYITNGFSNLYSALFDGVDEGIVVADNSAFTFGNGGTDSPFSGSAWIQKNATGNASIICKAQTTTTAQEYFFVLLSNQLYFWIVDTDGTGDRVGRSTTVTITNDGLWHHVAFTYSGNKAASGIKLYIDGTQRDTANFNSGTYGGMSNTIAPLRIGTSNESFTWSTNGLIAHPCMFNKELSATEVTELYNLKMNDARNLSFGSNLVEAWHFPTGIGDYPTYTGYKAGYNGNLTNMEAADINSTIPT